MRDGWPRSFLARLFDGDERAEFELREGQLGWLHAAVGSVAVTGQRLEAGDGASIGVAGTIVIEAGEGAEVLLFGMTS
ncbi:MAG: hypothetical protein V2J24_22695 [Pseudomonadales bacterium]|nr:hypothetical protein [Pseudomonadales bacterium]